MYVVIWARKTDDQYLLDVKICQRGFRLGYVPGTTYKGGWRLSDVRYGIGNLQWAAL